MASGLFLVADSRFLVADSRFLVAGSLFLVADGLFLVVGSVFCLPEVFFWLPAVFFWLPAGCFLLPTGCCPVLSAQTQPPEHKIVVFVLFWPSEPPFSGFSSTKSGFLCSFTKLDVGLGHFPADRCIVALAEPLHLRSRFTCSPLHLRSRCASCRRL